jgi:hypothetical protein
MTGRFTLDHVSLAEESSAFGMTGALARTNFPCNAFGLAFDRLFETVFIDFTGTF